MIENKPIIINDVQYEDLPFSWIRRLGLDKMTYREIEEKIEAVRN